MRPLIAFIATSFAFSPVVARAQVTAPDAELQLVGDGFQFTEGPTADSRGDVYFTDQPNDRIVKYEFDSGETSDWMSPCGRSNGLYFVAPSTIIACADENNQLWRINIEDQSKEVIVNDYNGQRLSGPNDCWVDQDGTIYFTDPLYKRPYWKHSIPDDNPRGVYRVTNDGKMTRVADGLKQPNGIIGDLEKRILYVADIGDGKTYRYQIADDGSLTERELFCSSGSDGMTMDTEGNVYLTGRGVTVYNASGELIQTIEIPRRWTANVTFAGPNNDHLFITAGDAVFTIKTKTKGK